MPTFRFDRLLTIYIFHNLKRLKSASNQQIPILMYHSISGEDDQRIHPYYKTNTTPEVFARHMSFLCRQNYRVINLNEAIKHLNSASKLQEKYVVITFDDGYHDFYENAFPILRKHNYTATVYLPTQYIGDEGLLFKGRKCLTWRETRHIASQNITIGSHTVTHPLLISLSRLEIEYELGHSKSIIEDMLGKPVESFSYPYAFPEKDKKFVQLFRNVLLQYGYCNSVSTIIGTEAKKPDYFILKRIPVNSNDDELLFKAKLEGAYDWVSIPQGIIKYIKYHVFINKKRVLMSE